MRDYVLEKAVPVELRLRQEALELFLEAPCLTLLLNKIPTSSFNWEGNGHTHDLRGEQV